MFNNKNSEIKAGSLLLYFFLVLLAIFFLVPFFIMILRSFMTDTEVSTLPVAIWPSQITFEYYANALNPDLFKYLGNTLLVAAVNVVGIPLSAALCAYGFARLKFKGRDFFFGAVMATLMLPPIVVQIPLYVIYYKLGWINTLNPLLIPGLFGGGAVNIFLIRQFMKGIPGEIENAAKIDGANSFQTFILIDFPLCMPVITYVAITTFLGVWNDFAGPLMYIWNEKFYTLAVGIYYKYMEVSVMDVTFANVKMATGVLLLIPPAILFAFFQKQLISGVATTGMKV